MDRLLLSKLSHNANYMLGYPINCKSPCGKQLGKYLRYVINNLGDPFYGSNYALNTFEVEREVIAYFAGLFHLKKEDSWGYVTNSGSESNLRGISFGVKKFPTGVLYFSDASHYSVYNAASLTRCETVIIKTLSNGEINLQDFTEKLDRNEPAIVSLNVGSTMTGAIDSVASIIDILNKASIEYYVHVDAALAGAFLPATDRPPKFDFALNIDSLTVSGHKFLGTPIPCGVFICRRGLVNGEAIGYIGSMNNTICGSRDGISAIAILACIKKLGPNLINITKRCFKLTDYLFKELCRIDVYNRLKCWRNSYSTTIVFQKPSDKLVKKWQLACDGDCAHVIIMPHVTKKMLKEFLKDIKAYLKEREKK